MKELLVGNAPCSWGTLEHQDTSQQVPFNRMLDELVETGYTGTELGDWGYMPTDPAALAVPAFLSVAAGAAAAGDGPTTDTSPFS